MSEQNTPENNAGAASNEQAVQPSFSLQRTYVKDLSLEMPNAPQIFLEQEAPNVEVELKVGAQRLAESIFETSVTATVTTRIQGKVLYLIEATQSGIFEAANIPAEQLDPLLGIVCPTMLYPYLRATVADAITRTTLPALHLTEVNFQQMYEQRVAEAQQQAASEAQNQPIQ
ncbi:protein-export chaperone SecB [Paenalcaligenes sp. Me131]|uniref:protein-export chaperone SecB n=1 Tax=Paenalcaligenes sp. Me131 TaxID=3392636 RepID=UPI003D29BC3B